jgi:hypothetical protein
MASVTNIDYYDDDVQEAVKITIEMREHGVFGEKTFDIRPVDNGFNVYDSKGNLLNFINKG